MNDGLDISDEGLEFIASFEGIRLKLYNDVANNATIGIGHLVHAGPINGSESAEFAAGISHERALALLKQDASSAASGVRQAVQVKLTQGQFDALVSFAFNVGVGALQQSTLLKELNNANFADVPAQLARWDHAGNAQLAALSRRRQAEGELFARVFRPQEGDPPPLLAVGSAGDAVLRVQQLLSMPPEQCDGVFGPITKTAVEAFQQSRNLDVDGIVGPKTLAALRG